MAGEGSGLIIDLEIIAAEFQLPLGVFALRFLPSWASRRCAASVLRQTL